MSIQRAERLKKQWTDVYVRVRPGFPELQRFAGHTGQVRTVNMNCRLLVEFDLPADISWYDIAPECVEQIARPQDASPQHAAATAAKSNRAGTPSGAESTAAQSGPTKAETSSGRRRASVSPLDLIRQQSGNMPTASRSTAGPTQQPPGHGSPLDQIRAQNAGGAPPPAPASTDSPEFSAAQSAPVLSSAAASPLDQIRAEFAPSESSGRQSVDHPPAAGPEESTEAPADRKTSRPPDDSFRPGPLPESPVPPDRPENAAFSLAILDQIRRQAGGAAGFGTAFEQFRQQAND